MRELVHEILKIKIGFPPKYSSQETARKKLCVFVCVCACVSVDVQVRMWGGSDYKHSMEKHQEISQDCNKKQDSYFSLKGSLANPLQLWLLCFYLQTQLCLKDLGHLMLLRLASTAFKNVSFSLDETGKPDSQVWMRVSLLGTEFGGAVSRTMTRKKLKGKNCFC